MTRGLGPDVAQRLAEHIEIPQEPLRGLVGSVAQDLEARDGRVAPLFRRRQLPAVGHDKLGQLDHGIGHRGLRPDLAGQKHRGRSDGEKRFHTRKDDPGRAKLPSGKPAAHPPGVTQLSSPKKSSTIADSPLGIRTTDETMMRMPCRASFNAAAAHPHDSARGGLGPPPAPPPSTPPPVHQEKGCDLVGGHFPETEEDARHEDLKNRVRGSLELPNFSKN